MNKERIIALAELIESMPDGCEFDMGTGLRRNSIHAGCGTAGCIMGWAAVESTLELNHVSREVAIDHSIRSFSYHHMFSLAWEYLGLDAGVRDWLFMPELPHANWDADRWMAGYITDKDAATALRRVAKGVRGLEVWDFKKAGEGMNKERIIALAELIENLPDGCKFDMSALLHDSNLSTDCGTVGCIAGWAAVECARTRLGIGRERAIHHTLTSVDPDGGILEGGTDILRGAMTTMVIARLYLGIDEELADWLFQPLEDHAHWKADDVLSSHISAKDAATALRRVADGVKGPWLWDFKMRDYY